LGIFSTYAASTFIQIFILLRLVHAIICFIRDRRGGYWHSYSEASQSCAFPRSIVVPPVELHVRFFQALP